MILFILILCTLFVLFTYSISMIGDYKETLRQISRNKFKIFFSICLGPFILGTFFHLLQFTLFIVVPKLWGLGYYFTLVDKNIFDLDPVTDRQLTLNRANTYLMISCVYNFRYARETGIKTTLDLIYLVANVFMLPIIFYYVCEVFLFNNTFYPWINLYEAIMTENKSCLIDQETLKWKRNFFKEQEGLTSD